MQELVDKVNQHLLKPLIPPRTFLNRYNFPDEDDRESLQYDDPTYYLFYYYLGKYITPNKFTEIGFDIGVKSSCFLTTCKSVQEFVGIQETTKDSCLLIGENNIKSNTRKKVKTYAGLLFDDFVEQSIKNTDLMLINCEWKYDEFREKADFLWENTADGGYILVEYLNKGNSKPFKDFCKVHNREYKIFNSRYKIGIVQK